MDRFLDEMDNPLTESQGSAISSSEVRYGATSCDGGSPVPAAIPPSSSLESTAAVSSLHQGPVASAEDAVDDDKNQQSVTCASGKSVAGKNCCDSAGSSSACCHHAEGLQAQYQSISESVASDGENTADESGALVICEDATLESSKGPEDVEDRLDDSTSAKCVLGGETALASPNCSADTLTVNSSRDESHAAAFPVATSRPCLESDSVALINIRVAADVITSFSASAEAASSNSFGAEVSSTDETSGHYSASHPDALGSELAGITGSLEALSGNLPVAGILSAVTDVISSSGDSTLVASAAIPSESVSLPFAMSLAVANTPTSDVLPSVQPMAVSACATLSADLTDIPVETLVPPVDLTDVDPMDVSIDTLVPLVDRADCVGNDAEMVSGGVDKMEVKSSSADSTFDAFSLASFPPLGVSDALVDGPSLAKPEPTVVVSNSAAVVVESVDGEGSLLSTTEHVSVGAKSIGLVQENQIALSPETKSSPCSSDVVPSVMSLSSTELVSSGELNVVGASVSPSGGAAVCASANGSVATELSSLPVEIDTGCQTADANAVSIQPELSMCEMAPSSEMQRPSSAAASESNKPCVESAGSGDAAVHPADIDNASHTNSSEVFDVVSSSAGDVGNTNGSSDDLSATPVTSDGCKTVAVSCPDVRSADDARKVPSSSSFPPVLSDCHVGSSLMSS
jgi:hypothetical protein